MEDTFLWWNTAVFQENSCFLVSLYFDKPCCDCPNGWILKVSGGIIGTENEQFCKNISGCLMENQIVQKCVHKNWLKTRCFEVYIARVGKQLPLYTSSRHRQVLSSGFIWAFKMKTAACCCGWWESWDWTQWAERCVSVKICKAEGNRRADDNSLFL